MHLAGFFAFKTLTNQSKAQQNMATTITKEEFDALPDSLKTKFKADGDTYALEEPDVEGLKNKNTELLGKLKGFKDFDGLDAAEVKAKLKQLEEQETADAVAKGKWEELEKNLKARHEAETAALNARIEKVFGASAEKDLQLALVAAGVKENLAEDLAISLRARHIKPVEDGGKAIWKTLDDTETVDLGKYIPGLKESKADYFKSDLGSGSGASGSGNGNGGQKQDLSSLPATARLTQLFEQKQ